MGVYQRPDSPFWWIWLEGAPSHQARVNTKIPIGSTPYLRKDNREKAERIYSALMGDRARDRFKLPTTRDARTFNAQREWYAANVSTHKRGTARELSMLRQLGEFFDTYDLAAIDRALVREWQTWRRRSVKASTVNREEAILKHLLTESVPTYLETNPLAGLPRLRPEDVETRILSLEEEARLLKAAKHDPSAYAAILCGVDALMRRGSVAKLARAQDHGTYLTLLNAKQGTYKVPISARLRQALDQVTEDGARYFAAYARESELSAMFTAFCAKANILTGRKAGGVTFHALRHTGASRMLARGVDIKTVMRIGGWAKLAVLERYLHPTDAAAVQAVESIGAAPVPLTKFKKSRKRRRKR